MSLVKKKISSSTVTYRLRKVNVKQNFYGIVKIDKQINKIVQNALESFCHPNLEL